jgi:hypothetical protein
VTLIRSRCGFRGYSTLLLYWLSRSRSFAEGPAASAICQCVCMRMRSSPCVAAVVAVRSSCEIMVLCAGADASRPPVRSVRGSDVNPNPRLQNLRRLAAGRVHLIPRVGRPWRHPQVRPPSGSMQWLGWWVSGITCPQCGIIKREMDSRANFGHFTS